MNESILRFFRFLISNEQRGHRWAIVLRKVLRAIPFVPNPVEIKLHSSTCRKR